jgi:hypothetical protein
MTFEASACAESGLGVFEDAVLMGVTCGCDHAGTSRGRTLWGAADASPQTLVSPVIWNVCDMGWFTT